MEETGETEMAAQYAGSSDSEVAGIFGEGREVLEVARAEEEAAVYGVVSGRAKGKC